jgi:hypothetical protein
VARACAPHCFRFHKAAPSRRSRVCSLQISVIGSGAHGLVLRAVDTKKGDHVALKCLQRGEKVGQQHRVVPPSGTVGSRGTSRSCAWDSPQSLQMNAASLQEGHNTCGQ